MRKAASENRLGQEQADRVRIHGKQPVKSKPPGGKSKQLGGKHKQLERDVGSAKVKKTQHRVYVRSVDPPCKLVKRLKDDSAYILAKDKVYVASASDRTHGPTYMKGLEALIHAIDKGEATTQAAANEFLNKFFDA